MKQLSSAQVRQMWLDFWATKGHSVEPVSYTHLWVSTNSIITHYTKIGILSLDEI